MEKTMIEKLARTLDNNRDIVFAVPLSCLIDEFDRLIYCPVPASPGNVHFIDGKQMMYQFLPDFTISVPNLPYRRLEINFASALFRRESYIRIGKADMELEIASDLLIESTLCLLGKVALVDEVLFKNRIHNNFGSVQSRRGTYVSEFSALYEKLLRFTESNNIEFDYNLREVLYYKFGKFMFSFGGGLNRMAAKYDGSYFQRNKAIWRTTKDVLKMSPNFVYSPKAWFMIISSMILPRGIISLVEQVYWKSRE